jgi:hypothetical protein
MIRDRTLQARAKLVGKLSITGELLLLLGSLLEIVGRQDNGAMRPWRTSPPV